MKRRTLLWVVGILGSAFGFSQSPPADAGVAYPEGYRDWVHVKSALISPAHATYATNGGFHHIYANGGAISGYRTRSFPEGSAIVFDWREMK